jgi:hypothetical protein
MKRINISLTADQAQQLKIIAKSKNLTVSKLIRLEILKAKK